MQQKVHLDFLEFTPRKRKRNERNNVTNDIPTIRSLNQLLSSRSKMYKKHFPFQNYELQCAWLTYFLIEISSRTFSRYIIHIIYDILYCCVIFSYFLRNWCLSEKAIMAINTGFCTVLVAICFWKQVHLHRNDTAKVNYISLRLNLNKETNVEKFLSQSVQVDQTLIFHFNKQMVNLIY